TDKHRLAYNFLYINSSDLSRDIYSGSDRDFEGDHDNHLVQRGTFTQNTVLINQLLGNHQLNEKIDFDWGLSYNTVESDMPDRTQNKLFHWNDASQYTLAQRTITDNHRYFQNLIENEIAAKLALSYKLGTMDDGDTRVMYIYGTYRRITEIYVTAIQ